MITRIAKNRIEKLLEDAGGMASGGTSVGSSGPIAQFNGTSKLEVKSKYPKPTLTNRCTTQDIGADHKCQNSN